MISLPGAVVVEGKYDKIKLSGIVDCPIITTDGFGVFKSPEKRALIRHFAEHGGIVVLTDSDSAGFRIRGYIKGIVNSGSVKNVYIPEIFGKERRKLRPSAEGKLGVEGVSEEIIREAFKKSGITGCEPKTGRKVTSADLYEDGLFGGKNSSALRSKLLERLGMPSGLSTSGTLDVINSCMDYGEYKKLASEIAG